MSQQPVIRLGVVGTGYVGLTTGACFAHLGHHVTCGDVDQRKVDMLNNGVIPIVEDGLASVVDAALVRRAGSTFVLGAEEAARDADIVFLCVPTPQGDDGSADLSYIEQAARQIAPVLKPGAVVVNKSTGPGRFDASSSKRRCSAPTCSSCRTPSSCVRELRSATSSHPTGWSSAVPIVAPPSASPICTPASTRRS